MQLASSYRQFDELTCDLLGFFLIEWAVVSDAMCRILNIDIRRLNWIWHTPNPVAIELSHGDSKYCF